MNPTVQVDKLPSLSPHWIKMSICSYALTTFITKEQKEALSVISCA